MNTKTRFIKRVDGIVSSLFIMLLKFNFINSLKTFQLFEDKNLRTVQINELLYGGESLYLLITLDRYVFLDLLLCFAVGGNLLLENILIYL